MSRNMSEDTVNASLRKTADLNRLVNLNDYKYQTVDENLLQQILLYILPRQKNGNNAIMTFVDRFTKRGHFIPSKGTDDAKLSFKTYFDYMEYQTLLSPIEIRSSHQKFCLNF